MKAYVLVSAIAVVAAPVEAAEMPAVEIRESRVALTERLDALREKIPFQAIEEQEMQADDGSSRRAVAQWGNFQNYWNNWRNNWPNW